MATIDNFLQFDSDEIPVQKIFEIEGVEYKIEIHYNRFNDFYTCIIRDIDNNILLTNRLTYMSVINDAVIEGLNMTIQIVPINYDDPETSIDVTSETFEDVDLFLVGTG